jgi:hypothetical protein
MKAKVLLTANALRIILRLRRVYGTGAQARFPRQAFGSENAANGAVNGMYNWCSRSTTWREQCIRDLAADVAQSIDTGTPLSHR